MAAVIVGLVAALVRSARRNVGLESAVEAERKRADRERDIRRQLSDRAAETQTALEKEIADAAQDRIDHGDPGARRRVQERWRAAAGSGGASSMRDGAAADPGAHPPGSAGMRGKR